MGYRRHATFNPTNYSTQTSAALQLRVKEKAVRDQVEIRISHLLQNLRLRIRRWKISLINFYCPLHMNSPESHRTRCVPDIATKERNKFSASSFMCSQSCQFTFPYSIIRLGKKVIAFSPGSRRQRYSVPRCRRGVGVRNGPWGNRSLASDADVLPLGEKLRLRRATARQAPHFFSSVTLSSNTDILCLCKKVERFGAPFATDAALFHTAEGDPQISHQPAIYPDCAGVNSFGNAMGAVEVLRPDA